MTALHISAISGESRPKARSTLRPLFSGFLQSAEIHAARPAVEVGGKILSYTDLRASACAIAGAIRSAPVDDCPPLTAVLAYRSSTAFAGILGTLFAGNGYVPLNPTFPVSRTCLMFERSHCRSIIVDTAGREQLDAILENAGAPLLVILPEDRDVAGFARRWPRHSFAGADELQTVPPFIFADEPLSEDAIAYLLFTSGSTGTPKGVAVAHRNVSHLVQSIVNRYEISEQDRFSQTFDLTFDLSVFDMFVAWERGACVCCPSQRTMLNPASFIRQSELTVWFSVPSVGLMMKKLGVLRPGIFPTLRWSLFCGEPLPVDVAAEWADAAPASTVENLYGPTELTIACMAYRWNRHRSVSESERNIVPIGYPLPEMDAVVVDDALHEVAPHHEGELLLSGPQLSLGYWHEPEKTSSSFIRLANRPGVYYRTGDRVTRPIDDEPMKFRGRMDTQIKVNGHRVELGEVEATIRQEARLDMAIAVGWPLHGSSAAGIEAFIADAETDTRTLREKLRAILPRYAVPRHIHRLQEWPLNGNGKIDRSQLLRYLERGS